MPLFPPMPLFPRDIQFPADLRFLEAQPSPGPKPRHPPPKHTLLRRSSWRNLRRFLVRYFRLDRSSHPIARRRFPCWATLPRGTRPFSNLPFPTRRTEKNHLHVKRCRRRSSRRREIPHRVPAQLGRNWNRRTAARISWQRLRSSSATPHSRRSSSSRSRIRELHARQNRRVRRNHFPARENSARENSARENPAAENASCCDRPRYPRYSTLHQDHGAMLPRLRSDAPEIYPAGFSNSRLVRRTFRPSRE